MRYIQIWNEPNLAAEWGFQPVDAAGRQFGFERLIETIDGNRHRSVGVVLDTLVAETIKWSSSNSIDDDISALAIELR